MDQILWFFLIIIMNFRRFYHVTMKSEGLVGWFDELKKYWIYMHIVLCVGFGGSLILLLVYYECYSL